MLVEVLAAVLAVVIAALLTGGVYRLASTLGFLDLPNARSSHERPTPRGGGLAIVLTTTAAELVLFALGRIDADLLIALAGGGALVAIVGLIDDRRPLPVALRLLAHFAAAGWALWWLGGLPPVQIGGRLVAFGWLVYPLGLLGIVWTLNLFNFMDGIDGIAASEAVFIAVAGAVLFGSDLGSGAPAVLLLFAASCAGFLLWNWPPARIFMGDVGSGYLGFLIAVVAVKTAAHNAIALPTWLILGAVFFVDATVTFLRRLIRGKSVYIAHRSHAYQRLTRRWKSHARVTVTILLVDVLWLLPLATLAVSFPTYALWFVLAALTPLVALALRLGAGHDD